MNSLFRTRSVQGVALILFPISVMPVTTHGSQLSHTTRKQAQREFNGVVATFKVENPTAPPKGVLRIKLTLQNISHRAVRFSYVKGPFVQHVEIYDASNKIVYRRIDAPIPEPAETEVSLQPKQRVKENVTINLGTYYGLSPGQYKLRFYYDLRLLEDQALVQKYSKLYHSDNLVLWNTRPNPFSIQEHSP